MGTFYRKNQTVSWWNRFHYWAEFIIIWNHLINQYVNYNNLRYNLFCLFSIDIIQFDKCLNSASICFEYLFIQWFSIPLPQSFTCCRNRFFLLFFLRLRSLICSSSSLSYYEIKSTIILSSQFHFCLWAWLFTASRWTRLAIWSSSEWHACYALINN